MARHTPDVALVPAAFFDEGSAWEILSRTVQLDKDDKVGHIGFPEYSAELVYSIPPDSGPDEGPDGGLPEMYHILKDLQRIGEYNKIVASYAEGLLQLAIAQGKVLLLANTFEAADFTTAEYFLFMAVKKLQINPEVSTIHFRTPLSGEEEMSLYRYFKAVEQL